MLMQSYDGFIYLLPALPAVWKNGEVKGLVARGGFEMDITWRNNQIEKVVVKSRIGGNCRLRSLTPLKSAGLKAAKGENSNPLFEVPLTGKPLINKEAKLNLVVLKKTYLYDLKTKKGEENIVYGK